MKSRIAKKPIMLPEGVTLTNTDRQVTVKGKQGSLQFQLPANIVLQQKENVVRVLLADGHKNISLAGTTTAILLNMVSGVTTGFERRLELVGVGYRAKAEGSRKLTLNLGHSHPVIMEMPEGVEVSTPEQTVILLKSANNQLLGQVAANIRRKRPPEPYKGKGVRYAGEVIIKKEGKKK